MNTGFYRLFCDSPSTQNEPDSRDPQQASCEQSQHIDIHTVRSGQVRCQVMLFVVVCASSSSAGEVQSHKASVNRQSANQRPPKPTKAHPIPKPSKANQRQPKPTGAVFARLGSRHLYCNLWATRPVAKLDSLGPGAQDRKHSRSRRKPTSRGKRGTERTGKGKLRKSSN